MLAKAELHVHLEGTAPPELIARIAARNGLALPDGMLSDDGPLPLQRFSAFSAYLRPRRERDPYG